MAPANLSAQAGSRGWERRALVKVRERVAACNIKIPPDTLVSTSGADGAGASSLFSAYLATLLRQQATTPTKTYTPKEQQDYQSTLTQEPSSSGSSGQSTGTGSPPASSA